MIYIIPNWLIKYLGKEDLFTVQAANYLRCKNQIKAQDDLINKGWKCVTVWDIDSFINEIEIFRKD